MARNRMEIIDYYMHAIIIEYYAATRLVDVKSRFVNAVSAPSHECENDKEDQADQHKDAASQTRNSP